MNEAGDNYGRPDEANLSPKTVKRIPDELSFLRELEQRAQQAWKECPYENWLLVRALISNRLTTVLENGVRPNRYTDEHLFEPSAKYPELCGVMLSDDAPCSMIGAHSIHWKGPPDCYCITLATGECVSEDPRCMHQARRYNA